MKIKDIKSDEVREEAVRLAKMHHFENYHFHLRTHEIENKFLFWAFPDSATEYPEFWYELRTGKIPNTPDLKLPKQEL
jgi:hypothetical protein